MWTEYLIILSFVIVVEPRDVTLTFFYDRISYLSCEKENSNSSSVWLKENIAINVSADPNLSISPSGSLIFDKFAFSDTGDYQCEGSDTAYTLIIECPSNSEPNTLSNECVCSTGSTGNTSLSFLSCYLCPKTTYKPITGQQQCFSCPTSLITELEGSVSYTDCVCPPGQGISSSLCVPCPADFYQDSFIKTPCVSCPLYSATPQPFGESDAEAFTRRSDCNCQYSPGNAANATCWPFITAPIVSLLGVAPINVTIQWVIQSYARADDGTYQGVVAGYHLEVRRTGRLRTIVFSHKYTPIDYTPDEVFNLTLTGLAPDTLYSILVNAYTKSSSFVDGPPFNLTVMTSSSHTSLSTTTFTTHMQTSGTPGLVPDTTRPTTTAKTTSTITTLPTTHSTTVSTTELPTTNPTTKTTEQSTIIATEPSYSTKRTNTTTLVVPTVIAYQDDSVTIGLVIVVLLLAVIIAVIVGLCLCRYCYRKRRGARKMRYVRAPMSKFSRSSPDYGLCGNPTVFASSKDDDETFI